MSDLPYLMQDPVKDELWLVINEMRLLITPEIYDLLASNGAELPPAYGIEELREQNAKLRELVEDMLDCIEIRMSFGRPPTSEMYENFAQCARELGVEP